MWKCGQHDETANRTDFVLLTNVFFCKLRGNILSELSGEIKYC